MFLSFHIFYWCKFNATDQGARRREPPFGGSRSVGKLRELLSAPAAIAEANPTIEARRPGQAKGDGDHGVERGGQLDAEALIAVCAGMLRAKQVGETPLDVRLPLRPPRSFHVRHHTRSEPSPVECASWAPDLAPLTHTRAQGIFRREIAAFERRRGLCDPDAGEAGGARRQARDDRRKEGEAGCRRFRRRRGLSTTAAGRPGTRGRLSPARRRNTRALPPRRAWSSSPSARGAGCRPL